MNRLIKCINFQLKSMAKSIIIFLCIYLAVCLALLLMSLSIKGVNTNGSMSSGFYIGGAIFAFIYVIANYREMFNYLLMFGNTRKNIFLSTAITSAVMSILLAIVSLFSLLADDVISKIFYFRGASNLLSMIYNNSNIASEFLWFSAFFIMLCSFSMLYGSLAYKLGKVFITLFWVCFGLSWMVLPVAAGIDGQSTFFNTVKAYFCAGDPNGILLAPINFIITAVIFGAITYVISTKQSQIA